MININNFGLMRNTSLMIYTLLKCFVTKEDGISFQTISTFSCIWNKYVNKMDEKENWLDALPALPAYYF
jgi:hypothetical protein